MPVGRRQPQGGWRTPSLRGALMIDATRGSIRVRSWPKPRPGPRHPTNEFWTMWLKAATYLYRYQPASVQWELQEATRGTVYMPRDLFISACRGRAFLLQDELGRKYYPMAFVQDVSDSLDAIGQFPGMMLFRGEHLWQPIQPGTAGDMLVYVSDSDSPEWLPKPPPRYQIVRIMSPTGVAQTVTVNSLSYVFRVQLAFTFDYGEMPFTSYRVICSGNSNAAGQSTTMQLVDVPNVNTPLSAAGNDLTVPNTPSLYDSGWISVVTPPSAFQELALAIKGSNATVDLTAAYIDLHLRID